jgi:hypothetical protein
MEDRLACRPIRQQTALSMWSVFNISTFGGLIDMSVENMTPDVNLFRMSLNVAEILMRLISQNHIPQHQFCNRYVWIATINKIKAHLLHSKK